MSPGRLGSLLLPIILLLAPGAEVTAEPTQEVVAKGLRIEFSLEPAEWADDLPERLIEGAFSDVRFRVSEEQTGNPVTSLQPAVWISRTEEGEDLSCRDRVGRHLQGMLSFQADVDLNKYFILILNDDQTISVVDPLLGVSGVTQLYTMVVLEDRGSDWARSADDKLLFVTMERVGKVAVVDLETFDVLESIEVGPQPTRIVLQPDGRYLWVTNDVADQGGVTVVDSRSREVVARIATGPGTHHLAFSNDSLSAFVTNSGADTVSVIDVQRLEKVTDIATGHRPVAVEYSALGAAAYVAAADGAVVVVDAASRAAVAQLETSAGLADFRFDPSGRWGFAAIASGDRVDIVDASERRVVHRVETRERPHQVVFTDSYAYIRHLGSAEVGLVPLAALAAGGAPGIQAVVFGSKPPEEPTAPAAASSIAPTGEYGTVVAANPSDRMVYYYMEGMIAPMGSYSTYGRVPRAVGVVDRSLRETDKGVYSARFRLPQSGEYTVAFLLDAPWLQHCFTFTAEADPTQPPDADTVRVEYLTRERTVPAGEPLPLELSLARAGRQGRETALADLVDVFVLATRPPGVWQRRLRAEHLGEGRYRAVITPVEAGAYYVSVAVPSLGVGFTDLPFLTLQVEDRQEQTPSAAAGRGGS